MKVSRAIKILAKYHDMDEEIMIDWMCEESHPDLEEGVWKEACDNSDHSDWIVDRDTAQALVNDVIYNREKANGKK